MTTTNPRGGDVEALLAGFQSSKGTVLASFTGSGVAKIWTAKARVPVGALKSDDESWNTELAGPAVTEDFNLGDKPASTFECYGSPTSVEWMLRSNFGEFDDGEFTLDSQVRSTSWLTLLWLEHISNTAYRAVRIRDAWVHRLAIIVPGSRGHLLLRADFAGEKIYEQLVSEGGLTLPASYTPDKNTFPAGSATFVRDPEGDAIELRIGHLEILISQGLHHDWDDFQLLFETYKTGRTSIKVNFRGTVSDETWALIRYSREGTKHDYRLTLDAPSPATTLEINLLNLAFQVREVGRDGRGGVEFEGTATATGDMIEIQLS